jgi:hypothetical protein
LKRQWVIGEITPEFLARMERVLATYAKPYDPKRPVICFDERPCFLIENVLMPIPMSEGQTKREHYEYKKNGSACVLLAFEAHTGRRFVQVYLKLRRCEEVDDISQIDRNTSTNVSTLKPIQTHFRFLSLVE